MTVPAKPQSIDALEVKLAGEMVGEVVSPPEILDPKAVRAPSINFESREIRAPANSVGSEANAASKNSRLVSDFEPGKVTVAFRGARKVGAGHSE